MKLTPKQKRFCQHYAVTGNASEAARQAGYSAKTAYSIGGEILRKPEIRKYLEELTGRSEEARITTAIERQVWLSKLIFGEIKDYHMLPDGTVIERPAKFADRIRAAELLARMRGELVHTHNLSGNLTTVVRTTKWYDGSDPAERDEAAVN